MSTPLRSLSLGLLAGLALSAARAPLGLDLFSVPAVDGIDAAAYRAFALGAIAMALGTRATRALPSVPWVLAGTAAGFGAHGFFGMGLISITSFTGLALLVGLSALAMGACAGRASSEHGSERERARPLTQLGLVIGGAGVALTLDALTRPLRLLGLGTTADDTTFGFAFLCLLAIGAISFRGLVDGPRRGRPSLAAGLALGSAACLYGVAVLAEFSTNAGLDGYLRLQTWDLDTSYIGMLQGDLLIAGRTLLLPAFVLGAALCGARRAEDLARVVIGAGAALLLQAALATETIGTEQELALLTSERAAFGVTFAALGGILALVGERHIRSPATAIGLLVAVFALALPRVLPQQHVFPLSPWEQFPADPDLIVDTPEGLLTVEAVAEGGEVVTLDRRWLTPSGEQEAADAQRMLLSWETLNSEARGRGRVLLIGQLTPSRALVLANLGASRIDRTAAWHRSMPAVEALMFAGGALPPGEVLAPATARGRLGAGAYDLVLVPPVAGSSPGVDLPEAGETRITVWLNTDVHVAWRPWSPQVMLSSSGLDELCIGLSNAPVDGSPSGERAAFGSEVARLLTRPFERGAAARAAATQRLAEAARGTPHAELANGLALHFAAQRRSSPWETPAQRVELDPLALEELRAAALAGVSETAPGAASSARPGRFLRELWQGLARLLVEKREIELAYENLVPLAEAFAPWPELERSLAAVDMEMLDPASAAERLLIVVAAYPYDLRLRGFCADALAAAGRPAESAEQSRAALGIQPGRRDFQRRLAAALVQAGDPEGRPMIEALLRADPDDTALETYLGPGPHEPLPPPPVGGDRHDH